MTGALIAALGLGFVAGLRSLTAPAAVFVARGSITGIILAILALGELVVDLLPQTPSRTAPPALAARIVSGGVVGWIAGSAGGAGVAGAVVGIAGALIGAYGGRAVRIATIARIGAIPAALLEDVIAIGLAAHIVTR